MLLWFLGTPVSIAEVNHIFYAILFGDITEKCLTTWFMKTGIGSGNLFPMFPCFLNSAYNLWGRGPYGPDQVENILNEDFNPIQ